MAENKFESLRSKVVGKKQSIEQLAANMSLLTIDDNISIEVVRTNLANDDNIKNSNPPVPVEQISNIVAYEPDQLHNHKFLIIKMKVDNSYNTTSFDEHMFNTITSQVSNFLMLAARMHR